MIKYKVSREELQKRQALPLIEKIRWCCEMYLDFVEVHGTENVYHAYSGGKDSDVMVDIIEKLHQGKWNDILLPMHRFLYTLLVEGKPAPGKTFCNTGLEWPEIVEHVKNRYPETVVLKPKIGFTRFITTIGVAVGSKKIAMQIRRVKGYIEKPSSKNEATRVLYLTGIKRDGSKGNSKIPEKWMKLLNAPFKVTDKCCDNFKKDPFHEFEKITRKKPIVGTTAEESDQRTVSYMKTGCISWEKGKEQLRPISIFTKKDIWEYSEKYALKFCEVYYDRTKEIKQIDGSIKLSFIEAEDQTGCTFCLFGLHLEPKHKANRIQRIAISNPKYYDIIINKCNLGFVLKWLKIPYLPFKVKKPGKQLSIFDTI
jgi:3'-phosphoadenosine 5'-phosphosulfate sulfotransferase (PAPS reductase)/FAD synthetase